MDILLINNLTEQKLTQIITSGELQAHFYKDLRNSHEETKVLNCFSRFIALTFAQAKDNRWLSYKDGIKILCTAATTDLDCKNHPRSKYFYDRLNKIQSGALEHLQNLRHIARTLVKQMKDAAAILKNQNTPPNQF